MRRLWNLIKQDTMVMFRNRFHYAVIFLAALFIIMVNFLIPAEVKMTPAELIADVTPNKFMEKTWRQHGINDERFYSSEESLRQAVKDNKNSIGIIVTGTEENPKFIILKQGHELETSINYLKTSLDWSLGKVGAIEWPTAHEMRILNQESKPIPFNKNLVPLFLVLEVVMVGFLLISVMVFQEKSEGSIRAYRISPGNVHSYILSKGVTNVLLSLIYGVLVVVLTIGVQVNFLGLINLIILTSVFATFFGLMLSVHFRSLSEFIFLAVMINGILTLPMASYFFPAFSNSLIRAIPSYPVLFGMREILFPTGKGDYLLSLTVYLLIANVIAYVLSYWACKRRLMKEVA